MTTVKITVDETVYEYSSFVWDQITGEDPKKIVSLLSEGKGIVSKKNLCAHENIELLMQKVSLFVPRVRINHDYGYRTINDRWYKYLLKKKKSLKCMPLYLSDAVNQIIVKPYHDKISQLQESVKTELQLQKDGKNLTTEQFSKVEIVKTKIREQKKILAHLPRCTNDTLTTLLHEYVDNISPDENIILINLSKEITDYEEVINNHKSILKDPSIGLPSDKRLQLEKQIKLSKSKINECLKKRYNIKKRYFEKFYQEMTPQVIAEQLIKYSGTFWGQFNRNIKMIDVSIKIYSNNKSGKKSRGKVLNSRVKSTLNSRGESLILFPYAVLDTKVDEGFLADIDHDLKVYKEWDAWARNHPEKVFTLSYKEIYENYRKEFKTLPSFKPCDSIPEDEDTIEPPIPPTEIEMKCMELTEYLEEITMDDKVGREKVAAAGEIVSKFCQLDNYEERFSQLRRMIDSGTVKFPGGFAVGEITKMLNPEYIPNIR